MISHLSNYFIIRCYTTLNIALQMDRVLSHVDLIHLTGFRHNQSYIIISFLSNTVTELQNPPTHALADVEHL